eukprot:2530048-Pyramimonas_sp.AAC.1
MRISFVREDRILFPLGVSAESVTQVDLQEAYSSRHLPLSTLGLFAAGEIHKRGQFDARVAVGVGLETQV